RLARVFGVRVLRTTRPIDPARRELDEYFEGRRKRFDLDIDLALTADFNRCVLRELARVPYGEVVTYGELAARAARPRAARAVGTVAGGVASARADEVPGSFSGHGVKFTYPSSWSHIPATFVTQIGSALWTESFAPVPAPDPSQPSVPRARDLVVVASYHTNV